MTNHVHLLIQVSDKGSISKIMQAITIAHTRYYHYKYGVSGHVWQGRFKSPIVSNDEYLLTAMRYIEQNPVRAGIVGSLERYPYSSFLCNASTATNGLVDKEQNPVHNSLGRRPEEKAITYNRIVSTLLEVDRIQEVRESLTGNSHYISERFKQEIKGRLVHKRSRGRPSKKRN